ncbi:hypothetical protein C5167_050643, partial [Papaver somniferum]
QPLKRERGREELICTAVSLSADPSLSGFLKIGDFRVFIYSIISAYGKGPKTAPNSPNKKSNALTYSFE